MKLKELCTDYAEAILLGVYEGNDCQANRHKAICNHLSEEFSSYLHTWTKHFSENIVMPFWFEPICFTSDESLNDKKLTWLTNQYFKQFNRLDELIKHISMKLDIDTMTGQNEGAPSGEYRLIKEEKE